MLPSCLQTETADWPARWLPCSLGMLTLTTCLAAFAPIGRASTANFWLSNSGHTPDAPTINVLPGSVTEIGIWARPATNMNLAAFALNLISDHTDALTFQHIEVHNPILIPSPLLLRHQLVFDSTVAVGTPPAGPLGINLQPDRIEDFSGLTFLNGAEDLDNGGGIGPTCLAADNYCTTTADGLSWRIATVRFQTGEVGTSTELFLEIATKGIWHAGEIPTDTSATFGDSDDILHEWSVPVEPPLTQGPDHRNMHLGLPDAVINVVSTISDADFDDDEDVDGTDLLTWQQGFQIGTTHAQGDANGDTLVSREDLLLWQSQYGTGGSSLVSMVPEQRSITILLALLIASAFQMRVR